MNHAISEEIRYRLLRYLQDHPEASQRELARQLGVSVGKANYCLRALIEKGLLKVRNFRNGNNKLMYAYHLTPKGIGEKINLTYAFLRRKMAEYDSLAGEIERLNREVREAELSAEQSAANNV